VAIVRFKAPIFCSKKGKIQARAMSVPLRFGSALPEAALLHLRLRVHLAQLVQRALSKWEVMGSSPGSLESNFGHFGETKHSPPLWREVHLQVKMYKTLAIWCTFGGLDVAKVSDT